MGTLKVKCKGVVYDDCYESPLTGEILFAGNCHRYTPVDESRGHSYPQYPKHLIAVAERSSDNSWITKFKKSSAKVEIIRE